MVAPGLTQTATLPEIRARANAFVLRWRGETRERAEKDSFWNDFLEIFGIDRRRYGVFEYVARRYTTGRHGFVDLLIPGQMAVEHKSRGESLDEAMAQLIDYIPSLQVHDLPHTLVVCDFETFVVYDLVDRKEVRFSIDALPSYVDRFLFLAGYTDNWVANETEEEANLQATRLLARLHDSLSESGYSGHPLRALLTRLLYILFADDTQVWSKNLFHDYIRVKTAEDGSDLGRRLTELFEVLDTPHEQRSKNIDADLREFSYVNGGLFEETLRSPTCDASMRRDLLAACLFEWSRISPAIFGSLFQNVMTPVERRRLGAHYTSERDIMRTIRPLFLNELEGRLERAKAPGQRRDRLNRLRAFRNHLPNLRFFDPACGCGNFLILAYREVRRVELETLRAIRQDEAALHGRERGARWAPAAGQATFDISLESQVTVSQFYGIEIKEFPARIAETAIHLVDHQANLALSAEFGEYYVRLPITDTAHIVVDNALRIDWNDVLPATDCNYILGNPPFSGQGKMVGDQSDDLDLIWGSKRSRYLDYVTGWYAKTRQYVGDRPIKVAFVSTNSICQGEAVAPLWEPLVSAGFHIDFAHTTFLWTSEASGKAGVHVVIIGFSHGTSEPPRSTLYVYPPGGRGEPTAKLVSRINPYLADAADVFVRPRTTPLSPDLPKVVYGSKPADGGGLLVSPDEYDEIAADPYAANYLRPFIGARELIYSEARWCLWLADLKPLDLRSSAILRERLSRVREFRENSTKPQTNEMADTPGLFAEVRQPATAYLGIPRHVGESRPFYPVARFDCDVIVGDHNFLCADPDGFAFGIISSSMFMAWQKGIGGRIRADPRFSNTLTWNTFPLPEVAVETRDRVISAGVQVLDARNAQPNASLDELYEPDAIPRRLVAAHKALDKVVDREFAGRRTVRDNIDRLSILFEHYIALEGAGRLATEKPSTRKRRVR